MHSPEDDNYYREPQMVIAMMVEHVRPTDGCSLCGYQFGYESEGCHGCKPITDCLRAVEKTFEEEQ